MSGLYQVEFVPSLCKDKVDEKGAIVKPKAYDGKVVLRVPSFNERQELLNDSNQLDDMIAEGINKALDGEKVDDAAVEAMAAKKRVREFQSLLKSVTNKLPRFVVSIDIKRLEDGFVFANFDDVSHDSDMDGLIVEMATKLMGKFNVGKTKSAS